MNTRELTITVVGIVLLISFAITGLIIFAIYWTGNRPDMNALYAPYSEREPIVTYSIPDIAIRFNCSEESDICSFYNRIQYATG